MKSSSAKSDSFPESCDGRTSAAQEVKRVVHREQENTLILSLCSSNTMSRSQLQTSHCVSMNDIRTPDQTGRERRQWHRSWSDDDIMETSGRLQLLFEIQRRERRSAATPDAERFSLRFLVIVRAEIRIEKRLRATICHRGVCLRANYQAQQRSSAKLQRGAVCWRSH